MIVNQKANKIAILTSAHNAFDDRIFYKQAKSLVKAGYNVILIAQHEKDDVIDGVKIIGFPMPKSRFHRMTFCSIKILICAIKEGADIYHFHDPELMPVGVLLKVFTRAKVIYDVHEDYSKQILSKPYIPKIARKGIAFLIRLMEVISSRFFDGIITATDDILRNFSYHKKSLSIRNFPVLSNFLVMRTNKNNNIFNLIYVGGLTKIRGIIQIVQSLEFISSNNSIKLTLCGEFYPSDFEDRVRSLKGFNSVEYLGWIEPEKIPEALSKADAGIVCLLPKSNYINAMPTKLFEYMACSLPVVASDFPLWKEIVEGNRCGICVDPLNPKEIAQAVEYLMEHPDEAKQMGENGRKAVLEKYNWENESKKLISLYQKLLNQEK